MENDYRCKFAEMPDGFREEMKANPHMLMRNVFEERKKGGFKYCLEDEDEARVPKVLNQMVGPWHREKLRLHEGHAARFAVCEPAEFFDRWEKFSLGMFRGLNWDNVFIAGGAVLGTCSCLSGVVEFSIVW